MEKRCNAIVGSVKTVQISIITSEKRYPDCDIQVIQKNKNPSCLKPSLTFNSNKIFIVVPSCVSTPSKQFECWNSLVNCYVLAIKKTVESKKNSILFPELGKNLLWQDHLIVKAARVALEKCSAICPDDFTVVFKVSKEAYEQWDKVMRF